MLFRGKLQLVLRLAEALLGELLRARADPVLVPATVVERDVPADVCDAAGRPRGARRARLEHVAAEVTGRSVLGGDVLGACVGWSRGAVGRGGRIRLGQRESCYP